MSWIGFMLSWVEYEKGFITSGPGRSWAVQRVIALGGPELLENHNVGDQKERAVFWQSGLDPFPPPRAKIPGSTHDFALGTYNHGSI